MTGSQILQAELESIKVDLIAKHRELKMEASGDWINSLEVQTSGLSGVLWGSRYTEQLVHGRESGKQPPSKVIEKWIYDKGIQPWEENMTISTLAYLIARKIGREGTEYFKQGGTDLLDAVITPQRIQRIIDSVSEFHVNSVVSEVTGLFQKMAA